MKKYLRTFFIVISFFLGVVAFQNCSNPMTYSGEDFNSKNGISNGEKLPLESLYEKKCSEIIDQAGLSKIPNTAGHQYFASQAKAVEAEIFRKIKSEELGQFSMNTILEPFFGNENVYARGVHELSSSNRSLIGTYRVVKSKLAEAPYTYMNLEIERTTASPNIFFGPQYTQNIRVTNAGLQSVCEIDYTVHMSVYDDSGQLINLAGGYNAGRLWTTRVGPQGIQLGNYVVSFYENSKYKNIIETSVDGTEVGSLKVNICTDRKIDVECSTTSPTYLLSFNAKALTKKSTTENTSPSLILIPEI